MATPNKALLKQTLEHIKTHQGDWIQSQWITPADDREDPSCGTAYCFAGWAVALSGFKVERTGIVRIDQLPPEVVHRLDVEDNVFQSGYVGGLAAECGDVAAALLNIRNFGRRGDDSEGPGCHLFCGHNGLDDLERHVADLCGEIPEPVS